MHNFIIIIYVYDRKIHIDIQYTGSVGLAVPLTPLGYPRIIKVHAQYG